MAPPEPPSAAPELPQPAEGLAQPTKQQSWLDALPDVVVDSVLAWIDGYTLARAEVACRGFARESAWEQLSRAEGVHAPAGKGAPRAVRLAYTCTHAKEPSHCFLWTAVDNKPHCWCRKCGRQHQPAWKCYRRLDSASSTRVEEQESNAARAGTPRR
jgi:hypothetical protein